MQKFQSNITSLTKQEKVRNGSSAVYPRTIRYTNQLLACRTLNPKTKPKKQANGDKQYTINCSGAKAVKPIFDLIILQNPNWKETMSMNCDIMFLPHTTKDEEIYSILAKYSRAIINRYPNVKPLARKDTFQKMMACASDSNSDAFDFVPRTFVFPEEECLFHEYQKNNKDATFIAKPQAGNKGEHIVLFQDLRQVPTFTSKEMVVQRYIGNPMLIDGFKFDLRVYIVVSRTKDGEIAAFLADEGLARFCTETYKRPGRENFKNIYMHLTNYAVNKSADGFVDEAVVKDILAPNKCSKRTLTALYKQLEQISDQSLVDNIKESIRRTCAGTMAMLANMIQLYADPINPHNSKSNHVFAGSCYQIFGFDILLDSNAKAWLLEINDHPSMNPYVCQTDERGCRHEDCPISVVDLYVKKRVQLDTMDLLVQKRQSNLLEVETWGSLSQIMNFEDKNHQDLYETMQELRHLFLNLSKGQLSLTVHEYERRLLSNRYIAKQCNLERIDLHLLFQKVTRSQKQIEFLQFCTLIRNLKAKCDEKNEQQQGITLLEFIYYLGFK